MFRHPLSFPYRFRNRDISCIYSKQAQGIVFGYNTVSVCLSSLEFRPCSLSASTLDPTPVESPSKPAQLLQVHVKMLCHGSVVPRIPTWMAIVEAVSKKDKLSQITE